MADSNTIAMQGGVPAFDFYRPMLVAAQMRQQQLMEERQRFDMTKQRLGQVATELMATPPDQKANVWSANADRLVQEGWMTPQQYKQYGNYSPLLEQRLLASALEPAQFIAYQQQQQDRQTGREVLGKMVSSIGGGDAVPGATPATPGATPATPALVAPPIGNGTPGSPGPGGVVWPQSAGQQASALPTPALPPADVSFTPGSPKDNQDRVPALPPTAAFTNVAGGAPPVSYLSAMPTASGPAASFGTGPITPAQSAAAMTDSGALPPEAPTAPVMPPAVRPTAVPPPARPAVSPGSLPEGPGASVVGGMPSRQMVPFLAVAAGLPGVPEATQKVATELLKHSLQESAATPDQKEYWNTYVPQEIKAGRTPAEFTPWSRDNKAAGRQQLTIMEKGETAFSQHANKDIAERYKKIIEEADASRDQLGFVGQLRALGDQIETGGKAAVISWLADKGVKLGDPKKVSAVEAFGSLIDKLAPQQRPPGAGSTSDFDARQYKAALPQLIRTAGGNKFIMDVMEAVAQDKMERGRIAQEAQLSSLSGDPKEIATAIKAANEKLLKLGDNMKALNERVRNFGKEQSATGNIPAPPEGSVPLEIIK